MHRPLGRRECGHELEQYLCFSGWDMLEPVPHDGPDGEYRVEILGAREKLRLVRTSVPHAVFRMREFKARFFPDEEIDLRRP
jgi:hypothetical protein